VNTTSINTCYRDGAGKHRKHKDRAFPGKAWASETDEARIVNLERMVGRLTMENDLLKKVLQKLEEET
jgi:hypothetical protein